MAIEQSSSVITGPSATFSRRRFAGLLAGGALAAVASVRLAPVAGAQSVDAQALPTGNWVTTTALNLRESASTSSRILTVIPAGTYLTTYSGEQNGFRSTVYSGQNGWVAVAYLQQAGSSAPLEGPEPSQDFTATATVTTPTNFRRGASTASVIIATLSTGTVVNIGPQTKDGFRAVKYGGSLGWMIASSLQQSGGSPQPGGATGPASIISAANFRMDPSYGNNIIRVLPAGTAVTRSGRVSGDFVEVSTPGDIGWVFGGLVGAPTGPGPGAPAGSLRATADLNIREQANVTSRLLGVLPAGAVVNGSDVSANGYTPITYRGVSGYVLTQYLVRV